MGNSYRNVVAKFCLVVLLVSFIACSSVDVFLVEPNYVKKFNKILIVKPYTPASERDRVSAFFSVEEFTEKDEDNFYTSLTNSLKESNLFIDVIVTETKEEAEGTRGNIYLSVNNNVASIWIDDKRCWYARFCTTITFSVKNIVYFSKVYDIIEINKQTPANLKQKAMKKVIEELFKDLENQTLERPN